MGRIGRRAITGICFAACIFAACFLSGCADKASEPVVSPWEGWDGELYSADFSQGVPNDWNGKATENVSESGTDGRLVLEQSGASASKYAVYQIRKGVSYENFRLEMQVSVRFAESAAGWFGVLYHLRENGNKTSGYGVAVTGDETAGHRVLEESKKIREITSCEIDFSDGVHRIALEVWEGSAAFFLDGVQIAVFDCALASDILEKTYLDGELAIAFGNCKAELYDVRIKGVIAESENNLSVNRKAASMGVYEKNVNIAVVSRWNGADAGELAQTKAASVLVTMNADGQITDSAGNEMGTLQEIHAALKNKAYPIVRVTDKQSARKLLSALRRECCIGDVAVLSSAYDVLEYVTLRNTDIRGVYDISTQKIASADTLWGYVSQANRVRANTLVLGTTQAKKEYVDYIQARFKSAWVVASKDSFETDKAIACGASGVITDDEGLVLRRLKAFSEAGGRLGSAFNVAHRGNSYETYENSLPAFVQAYESGATHIELDIQITKDGKLAVMHDPTLNRTTDGTGTISAMTQAQISRYKITKDSAGRVRGAGVKIPFLEDVYAEFADKDCILAVEIKSGDERIARELARLTQEYDMESKVVIISFYNGSLAGANQLREMREYLPSVAVADLQTPDFTDTAKAFTVLNRNCAAADFGSDGNVDAGTVQTFTARGFALWVWMVNGSGAIAEAWARGMKGVTTDSVKEGAKPGVFLQMKEGVLRVGENGATSSEELLGFLQMRSLNGSVSSVRNGKIFSQAERSKETEVICYAENGTGQTVFGVFTVKK